MEEDYTLIPGSRFSIDTGGDEPTVGVFLGLSVMGSETALVVRLDDGGTRFVNSSMVVTMDLLERPSAEPERKSSPGSVYYG